jgi:hypothetical protein
VGAILAMVVACREVGWALVAGGVLGMLLAVAAVPLVMRRGGFRLACAAALVGAVTELAGGFALVKARADTDASVTGWDRPVERQRARRDGYLAARPLARLGLMCAALPVAAGIALMFASRRRARAATSMEHGIDADDAAAMAPRRMLGAPVVASAAALLSCAFAGRALVEPVPGRNLRAEETTRHYLDAIEDVEAAGDDDAVRLRCEAFEAQIAEHHGTLDRSTVPGLAKGVRRCVEERIQSAALLSDLATVKRRLETLSRSPFLDHDADLTELVRSTRAEVDAMTQPPTQTHHPALAPAVRLDGGSIGDTISKGEVLRVARTRYGHLRLCYENALRVAPTLEGRVDLQLLLGPKGNVHGVVDDGSSVANAGLVRCMIHAVTGLAFRATGSTDAVALVIEVAPAGAPVADDDG